MLPITILIPVDKFALNWLGASTMLERLLAKLQDIREIENIVLLTEYVPEVTELLGESWEKSHNPDKQIVRYSPPKKAVSCHPAVQLAIDVHGNKTDEIGYVYFDPLYPFLHSDSIQQVISGLLDSAIVSYPKLADFYFSVLSQPVVKEIRAAYPTSAVMAHACLGIRSKQLAFANLTNVLLGNRSELVKEVFISDVEAVHAFGTGLLIAEALTAYGQ